MALNRNLEKTIAGQVIMWYTRSNDGLSLGYLGFLGCVHRVRKDAGNLGSSVR